MITRLLCAGLCLLVPVFGHAASTSTPLKGAIEGPGWNRQVFIHPAHSTSYQLSQFDRYERVFSVAISPNATMALVYHQDNHNHPTELTLYQLPSRHKLGSIYPGWYVNAVYWYGPRIITQTDITNGSFVMIYDHQMHRLAKITETALFMDADAGRCIGLPIPLWTDGSTFRVYSLMSGKQLQKLSVQRKAYFQKLEKTGPDTYKATLADMHTDAMYEETFILKQTHSITPAKPHSAGQNWR
jgi:hypothetical protein